jgi:hypothetical protein
MMAGPDRSGLANQNFLMKKLPTINEDVYLFENESQDASDEDDDREHDLDGINLIVLSIPDEEEVKEQSLLAGLKAYKHKGTLIGGQQF